MLNQIGSFIPEGQLMRYKSNLNFNKNDLVNFKNFVEEKQAEAAANPTPYADSNSIQRISIKDMRFHYFEPTGDEELDRIIQLGYDYRKSCFDLTNRKDYEAMTAAEDFTGMTDAEIYKAIYEKYQHCYGKNFYEANAINYLSMNKEHTYGDILRKFDDELSEVFGDAYSSRVMKARREALYGNMKEADVRSAIMEKYMEDGNITLRNLFKALNEMDACGVGGEMMRGLNRPTNFGDGVDSIFNSLSQTESIWAREANMDKPVTPKLFQQLKSFCESHVRTCGGDPQKVAAINQIIEMCSGGYGSYGGVFVSKETIEEMYSRMGFTKARV
ncbi:MAG: hypothetical protein J1F11_11910 [Oscillospiraceae bacterium]|nr:hypothetical protein [Oscillospiraceae bacterium]